MKKALIVTTISGFVPQFEMNNVKILQDLGYEIHYASNFEHPVYDFAEKLFEENRIITHHFDIAKSPFYPMQNFRAYRQLGRLMKQEKFDLIHCHNPMGGVLGRLAGAAYNPDAVMIYTAHGFHFYRNAPLENWLLFYPVERLLAHVTDSMITINREDYQRAAKFRLKQNGKAWLIPGVGLDVTRFVPGSIDKAERKRTLGFSEDAFLLLSVGELNRNKNHQAVIRAIADLRETNICYAICGRGERKEKLEKLIRRKGLEGRVKLLGYRKDIEQVLQGADLFLFPSRREGFGMAAVEAMAAGVPLITSDCRGTREYMIQGKTGIIAAGNRPEVFRDAIRQLYENPEIREKMGIGCRERSLQFAKAETDRIMRRIYEEADRK